jgi:hypothetical protein
MDNLMPDLKRLRLLRATVAAKEPDQIVMEQWKCDTSACALGWASLDPTFNKEGLTLEWGPNYWGEPAWIPTYAGSTMYDAGARFFGITESEAQQLFDPLTDEEFELELSDKEAFLIRLDNLLEKHNAND